MPLPNIPVFQTFLNHLEFANQPNAGDYLYEVVIPESVAQDVATEIAVKEYRLWFKPIDDFTLDSLVARLQRELESSGHKIQRNAILTLLALFCILPRRHDSPVQCLNNLLSLIVDGDLNQFFVLNFSSPPTFQEFGFGSFTLGKLNSQRLSYRSMKADSDFFERWHEKLIGRLAIEREICKVRIFDWVSVKEENGAFIFGDQKLRGVWKSIMEAYFHFVSLEYFEEFWQQFVEQQELQVAVGTPFMGDRELRLFPSSSISIYLNLGNRWGCVAPHGVTYVTMNFGGVDKSVPIVIERLRNEFAVNHLGSGELHQTIRTYAKFVSKAKRHLIDHRPAEAYLHFIIALDLLFGDKEGLTRNITKRVAILVYQEFGISFQQAVKTIATMYDVRSRYVHEGNASGMSDIGIVQRVCEEVLYCLLRLQKDSRKNKAGAINEWRANLDYFVTAMETNRAISDADFKANGIRTERSGSIS